MAESAVSSVVRMFGSVAVEEVAFLRGVHDGVESLKSELRRMQCFLHDADDRRRRGDERVTNWVLEIREAAYDAEDVIEASCFLARRRSLQRSFFGAIARFASSPFDLVSLHKLGVEIDRIRRKIREIADSTASYRIADLGEIGSMNTQVIASSCYCGDDGGANLFVGFGEEINKISDELMDQENVQLSVVAIVGMGGSGKSTLARNIYNSARIKEHFDAMAWMAVSQKYKMFDLLKDVTKKIMGITSVRKHETDKMRDGPDGDEEDASGEGKPSQLEAEEGSNEITMEDLEKMEEEEVRAMLHGFLENRRFLIVLDDVWRTKTYSEINSVIGMFPKVKNGSRIILTTRDLNVAKHVEKRTCIHEKKLLDEKKSWELLEKKAFPEYRNASTDDRSRLEPIGKILAKKCKGLPLAIVVLGGYLSRNLDYDVWSGLVDNLDWEARKNDEPVWDILARSYHDLPNHQLRSCFLYTTSFPEDYAIRVSRLIKLWIAEGFVPQRQNRTMEETAREYVNELAQRCMVQVVERSKAHGWIKTVVIHDVLRDWGSEEARKEGFLNIWSNAMDSEASSSLAIAAYRVALHNFSGDKLAATVPKLRTLLVFSLVTKKLAFGKFKFLRVIDLYGLKHLKSLPEEIGRLVHLRYLGLRRCGDGSVRIPSSVGNLLNLQTLDARGVLLRSLPDHFWHIPTLRHVYISEFHEMISSKVGHLQMLQTLYMCAVCHYVSVDRQLISKYRRLARNHNKALSRKQLEKWAAMVEALAEMKQLVFLHLERWRDTERRRRPDMVLSPRIITVLSSHSHLRVLELVGGSSHFPVSRLSDLPRNLRKLKLEETRLREDPMPALGELPNLVVLVLASSAYEGESMACHAHGFPSLQHLTLDGIRRVKTWNVLAGAFPALTHLTLQWSFTEMACPPVGLLHVTSLREIQLKPRSCVSIGNVKKFEENGCKVIIKDGY